MKKFLDNLALGIVVIAGTAAVIGMLAGLLVVVAIVAANYERLGAILIIGAILWAFHRLHTPKP